MQSQQEHQRASDFRPTLGTVRGVGLPLQQYGGIGLSASTSTRPLQTDIYDQLNHPPQAFQFGATPTPSMNQGFNPSVPLNTAEQQHPWHLNSFYSSLDNPSAPLSTRRDLYSESLMGLDQQNQYFNVAGNEQNMDSLYGAQVTAGRYVSEKCGDPDANSNNVPGMLHILSHLGPMEHQSVSNLYMKTIPTPQECLPDKSLTILNPANSR